MCSLQKNEFLLGILISISNKSCVNVTLVFGIVGIYLRNVLLHYDFTTIRILKKTKRTRKEKNRKNYDRRFSHRQFFVKKNVLLKKIH